jgi:hypothetical protein
MKQICSKIKIASEKAWKKYFERFMLAKSFLPNSKLPTIW